MIMAAWLGRFAAALAVTILEWLSRITVGAVREWLARRAAEKATRELAEAVRKQTEAAVTPKEREDAADSVRDNF